MLFAETFAGVFRFHDDLSRTRGRRKLDVQPAEVLLVHFDPFDLFELLDARLHLVRFGRLVTEAFDEILGLFDHLLLVHVGRHLLLASFAPQLDVPAVRHAVVVHLAERYFDRPRGDVIEECAVVRNQHDRAVVLLQVVFEPSDALDVEVIRGFVEQEYRRPAKQQLCQFDAHPPSAAELAGRPSEVASLEAQSEQRLFDLLLAVHPAENVKAVGRIVQPVQQLFVPLAFVVRPLGDLPVQLLDFAFESDHFRKGRFGFGEQRGRVGHLHLLRQVAYRAVAVARNGSRRGRLFSDQHFQHRRFSRSVLAHQTDPVFGIDQERYLPEQIPTPEADRKIVYRYHRLSIRSTVCGLSLPDPGWRIPCFRQPVLRIRRHTPRRRYPA